MKKLVLILALLFVSANAKDEKTIIIGATPTPHGEIVAFTKPLFEKRGYKLVFKEFSDYITPNIALNEGELDANLYQHEPFLEDFNKNKGTKLVSIGSVVLVPMALYSNKIKKLDELKNGALIAVPNDPTNESRSLELVERAGLAKFKNVAQKTPLDISDNPKKLRFVEVEAAQVPRALADVDVGAVTTNYALGAGLNPLKDGIFIEDKTSRYSIVVAVRKGDEKGEKAKIIMEILRSKEVAEFINKTYKGAVIPTF